MAERSARKVREKARAPHSSFGCRLPLPNRHRSPPHRNLLQAENARGYSSVTQPRLAFLTNRMYLASVPREALYGGISHFLRRAANSSSDRLTLSRFFSAS